MKHILSVLPALVAISLIPPVFAEESMDKMWGERSTKNAVEDSKRAALFRDGNYGMFIHWGLYSHLGGQWKDKTFYGIGEWILRQMKIPRNEYMGLAKEFNPSEFNAKEIVRVAKEAGMKWIINLVEAGKWVKQNPSVVYGASPSPWDHAQPWGDVTRTGNTLNLVVFDWPADHRICLPGIDGDIAKSSLEAISFTPLR